MPLLPDYVCLPDWYRDADLLNASSEQARALAREALSAWQQACRAYEAAHPPPPVLWANLAESKAWEKERNQAVKHLARVLAVQSN